jgi:hypothetical protein
MTTEQSTIRTFRAFALCSTVLCKITFLTTTSLETWLNYMYSHVFSVLRMLFAIGSASVSGVISKLGVVLANTPTKSRATELSLLRSRFGADYGGMNL